MALASMGVISLFKDVNSSASVSTNSPTGIMEASEANNSTSNAGKCSI